MDQIWYVPNLIRTYSHSHTYVHITHYLIWMQISPHHWSYQTNAVMIFAYPYKATKLIYIKAIHYPHPTMAYFRIHDYTPPCYIPRRATEFSAGFDFILTRDLHISVPQPTDKYKFDTGICIEWNNVPDTYYGQLKNRSSLPVEIFEGVIDRDYHLPIILKFDTPRQAHTYPAGTKIAQILFLPHLTPNPDLEGPPLSKKPRIGGFGSTDFV